MKKRLIAAAVAAAVAAPAVAQDPWTTSQLAFSPSEDLAAD